MLYWKLGSITALIFFQGDMPKYTRMSAYNGYPVLACQDVDINDDDIGVIYYAGSVGNWNPLGGEFAPASEGVYDGKSPIAFVVHDGIPVVGLYK